MEDHLIDIQGHRGCRGIYPENTIPAFLHAASMGVTTLECDAVISKDHKVILSHEPFMSHEICKTIKGDTISQKDQESFNIYQLTYEEIKNYDCGSLYVDRFPDQIKQAVHKPSLEDVVSAVNGRLKELGRDHILYNLEIKRRKEWDNSHHPEYRLFADLVISQVRESGIAPHTTIQCFDIETLQYINQQYPDIRLVYLIENMNTPLSNIEQLGFVPAIYSPYYKLVDEALVEFCASKKMKLIPWTVNETEDMRRLISLGVEGIISDYPERLISLCNELATDTSKG